MKMLKIFIVDDDKIIRRGLRKIIEENLKECIVVGEANNGLDALNYILEDEINLVIADIKMPVMNGIKLIDEINRLSLDVRVVILSGFDDYNFVRKTMKLGAVDYLLKPIKKNSLIELVTKIKKEILIDIQKKKQKLIIDDQLKESMDLIRKNFILKIIRNEKIDNEDIKKIGINNKNNKNIFIGISIDNFFRVQDEYKRNYYIEFLRLIKDNILSSFKKNNVENNILIESNKNRFNIMILDIDYDTKEILSKLNALSELIKHKTKLTVTIGISKFFYGLDQANYAYKQASLAIDRRFYKGRGKVFEFKKREENKLSEIDINDNIEKLIENIEISNSSRAIDSIDKIFGILKDGQMSKENFVEIISDVIKVIFIRISECIRLNYSDRRERIINYIELVDTLDDFEKYIKDAIVSICDIVKNIRLNRSQKNIELVKEYIKDNYNKNIDLKTAAEYVNLNANYLSNLFKAETGINFSNYIIKFRIDEAKKLLVDPDYKIYEIGLMVGYEETVSFNRAFKKVVGVSPSKYRSIIK